MVTSRRSVLGGLVAGALGTQFLPIRSGLAQSNKPPLRLLTLIDSYGLDLRTRSNTWIASEAGDYELKESDLGSTLRPLSGYIENMLLPTGMDMPSRGATGAHSGHDGMAQNILCGSSASSGSRPGPNVTQKHESIDVRIGNFLNEEYGLAAPRVLPHVFTTDFLSPGRTTYCYNTSGRQIRARAGTQGIMSTLFGNAPMSMGPSGAQQISTRARLEVLSAVGERVRSLRAELVNANAATVMDAYRASVEDVTKGIELRTNAGACEAPGAPEEDFSASNDGRASEFVFEAIYHAFACDMVSSFTHGFGSEVANTGKFGFLVEPGDDNGVVTGLKGSLHGPSHAADAQSNRALARVRTYQSQLLAQLLDRLKATPDVDGVSSIFDNTVVFFPTYYASNTHKTTNYPNVIIAGKNANLRGGMHYAVGNATNNQLLVTLAQGLGLPDTEFGGFHVKGNRVASLNAGGPIEKMLRSV